MLEPATASFANYAISQNHFDEAYQSDLSPRPHWQFLLQSLARLGYEELHSRYFAARRLLRDNGVAYDTYSDPHKSERSWQLDPVPVALASDEWQMIERGLLQRAELLKLLLADIYGARQVVERGLLPAELLFSHSGFLRPACVQPDDGATPDLPFYAADLIRGPEGRIYIVADRTQSPTGAGYALENRMIMTRILPSLFRETQVHRLAAYFRTVRHTLNRLRPASKRAEGDIAVLTPGPGSDTYFEHVYLARYLGYPLVQSTDLTVRSGKVWLKTLSGLQTIDVLLRFVDDVLCDPLEFNPDSSFGVAGLLQAQRSASVSLANPAGSAILENPALLPYLPDLCQYLLGEELQLSSPVTFWCGDQLACRHVISQLDQLMIRLYQPVAAKRSPVWP